MRRARARRAEPYSTMNGPSSSSLPLQVRSSASRRGNKSRACAARTRAARDRRELLERLAPLERGPAAQLLAHAHLRRAVGGERGVEAPSGDRRGLAVGTAPGCNAPGASASARAPRRGGVTKPVGEWRKRGSRTEPPATQKRLVEALEIGQRPVELRVARRAREPQLRRDAGRGATARPRAHAAAFPARQDRRRGLVERAPQP